MYTLENYYNDIDIKGFKKTWNDLIDKIDLKDENNLLHIYNVGNLYELGLEYRDNKAKKENGKYFTPKNVASLMSDYFVDLESENVCDVCCGTGNLILSYLEKLGRDKSRDLIKNKKLYLYELDSTALYICEELIYKIYGEDLRGYINIVNDDFLNKEVTLPKNSKVIANPPYYKIVEIKDTWDITKNLKKSKDLYSAIMEKILQTSEKSVIITPYSFVGSNKFYELRKIMNNYNGFILSFDNVPGKLFNNYVRASITVTENKDNKMGYRVSPLIRFKTNEKERVLTRNSLDKIIPSNYQIIDSKNKKYAKYHSDLEDVLMQWFEKSDKTIKDVIDEEGKLICFPNTCRYFTVGSQIDLERSGKYILNIKEEYYNEVYALLNSSFAYWYWRVYDGGITYQKGLLYDLPLIDIKDKERLKEIVDIMKEKEKNYLVGTKNAGKVQENIKFPKEYIVELNNILLKELGVDRDSTIFDKVHSNTFF